MVPQCSLNLTRPSPIWLLHPRASFLFHFDTLLLLNHIIRSCVQFTLTSHLHIAFFFPISFFDICFTAALYNMVTFQLLLLPCKHPSYLISISPPPPAPPPSSITPSIHPLLGDYLTPQAWQLCSSVGITSLPEQPCY